MTPYTLDAATNEPTMTTGVAGRSWSFPSTWTPELAETFVTADDEERGEEVEIADLQALAFAPARIVEAKVQALAETRALRIAVARDLDEDAIYAKAVADYGGAARVERMRTPEGSIILRPLTVTEVDKIAARAGADGMTLADTTILYRGQLAASVVHPARPRFEQLVELYPGLWATLIAARDRLISGSLEAAEKKA